MPKVDMLYINMKYLASVDRTTYFEDWARIDRHMLSITVYCKFNLE